MTQQEAEAALEATQARHQDAVERVRRARIDLETIRRRATAGEVAPGQLAAARDEIELAELAVEGIAAELPPLEEAVRLARADAACDRISATLRTLGGRVNRSLDALREALGDFAGAASAYDNFVTTQSGSTAEECGASPRFVSGRSWQQHAVDGVRLGRSDAIAQLAAVLVPAVAALGAEQALVQDLRNMAHGAPILPTDDGR